jgi:hypothetical protein
MVEFAIPTGPISTVLWIAAAPDGDVWFTEWSADKIGVVHSNLSIPLTVTASEGALSLSTGGQAGLSLVLSCSQGISGHGTYVYSWPSYNPGDVNVTFSPLNQSLTGISNALTQARIAVSPNTSPGQYPLALGFDAGSVTVWTMVPTNVSAGSSITLFITNNLWFLIGAIIAAYVAAFILRSRVRRRGAGASAMPI